MAEKAEIDEVSESCGLLKKEISPLGHNFQKKEIIFYAIVLKKISFFENHFQKMKIS